MNRMSVAWETATSRKLQTGQIEVVMGIPVPLPLTRGMKRWSAPLPFTRGMTRWSAPLLPLPFFFQKLWSSF